MKSTASLDPPVLQLTDAQQSFVTEHTPLIYFVLRKLSYQSLPEETYEDLVMRLLHRLCVCATRFDPSRGVKPSSYLVNCFTNDIKNFFRDEIWMVRPSRDLRECPFSEAVDSREGRQSKAEQRGENPETIRTCANPLPLDALYSDEGGEDEFYLDVVASEDNVEAAVMAGEGGRQILRLIFDALRDEERLMLATMQAGGPLLHIQEAFRISHEIASEAWVELAEKVRDYWQIADEGGYPPPSAGSRVIDRVMKQRFEPELSGYLQHRRAIAEQQKSVQAV